MLTSVSGCYLGDMGSAAICVLGLEEVGKQDKSERH